MKKIAITGPESTAKSSLVQFLSSHFGFPFVPEYAREYMQEKPLGYSCSFDEITAIALEQIRLENKLVENNQLIFCDTDVLVSKIWQEHVFGKCDPLVETSFQNNLYQLHLLCSPDIEWEPDPLRSNKHDRDILFQKYKNALDASSKPYKIICGQGNDRFNAAAAFVETLLK